MFDESCTEGLVDEKAGKHEKRRTWHVEQRAYRIGQDVVETRPPAIRPHVAEGGHDAISDNGFEIIRDAREGIEADWSLDVGRIDVDQIIGTCARNVSKCGFREIAVRIEEGEPLAGRK